MENEPSGGFLDQIEELTEEEREQSNALFGTPINPDAMEVDPADDTLETPSSEEVQLDQDLPEPTTTTVEEEDKGNGEGKSAS